MVDEAVEDGRRNGGVTKEISPLIKTLVGGNNQRGFLGHGRYKAKEQIRLCRSQGHTKYQPIIREVDTFADATPQAVFSKGGEVILPSSGETAEDIAIAASVDKSGFLLGGGLNIVLPHKEIDSAFLAIEISFGTPHTELAKRAQGKSVVHLYNEDLKAVEISYPTIAEQKQISTLFDSFDNLITLHQRKQKAGI